MTLSTLFNLGGETACDESVIDVVRSNYLVLWENRAIREHNVVYDAILGCSRNNEDGWVVILYRKDGQLFARRLIEGVIMDTDVSHQEGVILDDGGSEGEW